jgi:hypothetical protein
MSDTAVTRPADPGAKGAMGQLQSLLVPGEAIVAFAMEHRLQISVGMFTARVTITYSANMSDTAVDEGESQVLEIASLTKTAAGDLYRVCQEQDQAWREKRRVRSMEEMRARSGGVQIATGFNPGGLAAAQPMLPEAENGPTQRLAHAKDLLDQHLITDAEYQEIKAKIIAGL